MLSRLIFVLFYHFVTGKQGRWPLCCVFFLLALNYNCCIKKAVSLITAFETSLHSNKTHFHLANDLDIFGVNHAVETSTHVEIDDLST